MPAKVLVVEDEFLIALDLCQTLEDLGYAPVGVAADRASAQRLAEAAPDIAIVDLHLRDGLTGALVAQDLASNQGPTIVFVTANPSLAPRDIKGAVGVITKPLTKEGLGAVVQFALERRAGRAMAPPPALKAFDAPA